jgi:hypothetical protein
MSVGQLRRPSATSVAAMVAAAASKRAGSASGRFGEFFVGHDFASRAALAISEIRSVTRWIDLLAVRISRE